MMERFTGSRPKAVTMLAEIFMLWLETTSRVSQQAAPANNSRFVPFYRAGLLEQKNDEAKQGARELLEHRIDSHSTRSI